VRLLVAAWIPGCLGSIATVVRRPRFPGGSSAPGMFWGGGRGFGERLGCSWGGRAPLSSVVEWLYLGPEGLGWTRRSAMARFGDRWWGREEFLSLRLGLRGSALGWCWA